MHLGIIRRHLIFCPLRIIHTKSAYDLSLYQFVIMHIIDFRLQKIIISFLISNNLLNKTTDDCGRAEAPHDTAHRK